LKPIVTPIKAIVGSHRNQHKSLSGIETDGLWHNDRVFNYRNQPKSLSGIDIVSSWIGMI
jgi:hypothetical protein